MTYRTIVGSLVAVLPREGRTASCAGTPLDMESILDKESSIDLLSITSRAYSTDDLREGERGREGGWEGDREGETKGVR